VAAAGGQIYDPACVPMASIGMNVPNLPYRAGLRETLDWARAAHVRWIRVFATGHDIGPDRAPKSARDAAAMLRTLVDQVAGYNANLSPGERIYVLVSLTDYYPPGVPGDRHAYDHPSFRDVPVLPAPWYRGGTRVFDFQQEHGYGTARSMPNYEITFKPWVREIAPALAASPALLGWQLGNELKARGSVRNDISPTDAYGWYLDFTRDIVDTIREADQNHVIFMGAQYMAELVDWDYRRSGPPEPDMLDTYQRLVAQMLDACSTYCWNVWGLTGYDGNAYPWDDAMTFRQAGVAAVFTELGFTREVRGDSQVAFRGDRVDAVRNGAQAAWIDIDGRARPRGLSVNDLFDVAGAAGAAPWGSPAPTRDAEIDADTGRGITFTPDQEALWSLWRSMGERREQANRLAGVSASCLALNSKAAN
jgi:hypothetical protein